MKRKPIGWRYESNRHALAARGIGMCPPTRSPSRERWGSRGSVPNTYIDRILSVPKMENIVRQYVKADTNNMIFTEVGHGLFQEDLNKQVDMKVGVGANSKKRRAAAKKILDKWIKEQDTDEAHYDQFDVTMWDILKEYSGIRGVGIRWYTEPHSHKEKYGNLFKVVKDAERKPMKEFYRNVKKNISNFV